MEVIIENTVASLSALIALASALVTGYFAKRSIQTVERQRRLQHHIELRKWADCVSDVLSETSHFIAIREDTISQPDKIMRLRVELSTLIDRGRWFFPNIMRDGLQQNKPIASQGVRQRALNRLINIYDVLKELEATPEQEHEQVKQIVFENRKAFIGDIFQKIDPRGLDRELEKI